MKSKRDVGEAATGSSCGWRSVFELERGDKLEGTGRMCKTNRIRRMEEIPKTIATTRNYTGSCCGFICIILLNPENIPTQQA